MNFRKFMGHYRKLRDKGWTRKDDDTQIFLRPPIKKRKGNKFSFSPLSAVYFELTGRRVGWGEIGTIYRGLKMEWKDVRTLDNVATYPNFDHPGEWKPGLKEELMKLVPVAK